MAFPQSAREITIRWRQDYKGSLTENMSTADKRAKREAIQMAFLLCLGLVVFAAPWFEFHPRVID